MRARRNVYSRRRVDPFGKESLLCETFVERARAEGLVCHPEASGWDVLVVDPETGEQAGLEAKLRPNVHVLYQAARPTELRPGPAVHAVLVPSASPAFAWVADELRIVVVEGWRLVPEETRRWDRSPLVVRDALFDRSPRWSHPRPAWEPEVEVVQEAGAAGPKRVTPWKIAAVKLCLRLREEGTIRRKDVLSDRHLKGSWGLWSARWLEPVGRDGRESIYAARPGAELPDERYPEIAEALRRAG